MGRPTSTVSEVRVTGPLAPFVEGLRAKLRDTGYTPLTTVNVLRLVAHLSRWLDVNQLAAADLTEQQVERYFGARRALGYKASLTPASVAPLLDVVRETGVFDSPERSTSLSATDVLLAAFGRFLCDERALATPTVAAYVERARRFLDRYEGCALFDLTADQVTSAVLAEASAVSVGSAQYYVAALRSFLRFCFIRGLVKAELAAAALAVTGRRRSPLPRGIDRGDASALLHSCDRRRPAGRRDYALLITLLRFGLRASEVGGLRLDDIDWRAAELVVRGKGQREDRLPLSADVGEAIAGYLKRGRPPSSMREVFLSAQAPVAPLGRGGVSCIVRRACVRAGIPEIGAHCLRHTAACEMVAAGVPLAAISQVLRHRSLSSTSIYARMDIEMLRSLAQAWPGGEQR